MKEIDLLIKDIESNKKEIKKIEERNKVLLEATLEHCPVKIGDIVKCNTPYTNVGKSIKINQIWFGQTSRYSYTLKMQYGWFAEGNIIKQDGTTGLRTGQRFIIIEED